MTDSLSFFTYIGLERIYQRGVALGDYLKQKIENRWGPDALWVQRNSDSAFATAITAFNPFNGRDKSDEFETMDSAITGILDALAAESRKIHIRSTTWRSMKTDSADNRVGFRVSTHAMYNNYKEIDHLFKRLVHHIDATGLPQLG